MADATYAHLDSVRSFILRMIFCFLDAVIYVNLTFQSTIYSFCIFTVWVSNSEITDESLLKKLFLLETIFGGCSGRFRFLELLVVDHLLEKRLAACVPADESWVKKLRAEQSAVFFQSLVL